MKPLQFTALVLLLLPLLAVCSISAEDAGSALAASEQYARGNALFQQGKFTEAIVEYQKVLADFSAQQETCAKAQMAIGKAYHAKRDVKNAESALLTAIKNYSSFPTVTLWTRIYLVEMYLKERMYSEATAACEELLSKHSDQADFCIKALYNISKTHEENGRIDEALGTLQKIIDGYPSSSRTVSDAMLARAGIFEKNQRHTEALAELTKLGEKFPRDRHIQVVAKMEMAKYLAGPQPGKAIEIAKELSKNEVVVASKDLLHDLLMLQRRQLRDPAWKETGQRYIELMSKSADPASAAFAPLEVASFFEGDSKKSAKLAAEFLEKYPNHDLAPRVALTLASSLSSSGDKDGALAAYNAVVAAYSKSQGGDAHIYVNLALRGAASILARKGRTEEAIQRIEAISTRDPYSEASKINTIAEIHKFAGNWKEAAKAFEREMAVERIPPDSFYGALYNLGECQNKLGDNASARKIMKRIIDESPESFWAKKARGLLYLWDN